MPRNAVADRERYDVLSRMLRERQAEIRNRLRSLREVLPAEAGQVRDTEEQSMQEFVSGMDFALVEMESATLRQIDQALLRLEDGTYGFCGDCDETISESRLQAVPFARLCRDCQERHEQDGRGIQPRLAFDAEQASRGRRGAAEKLPVAAASVVSGMSRTIRLSRA